ncbi:MULTISPECIES: SLC13 family permease [Psychrobacter]|uniref:Solute carrier family 13 (Sodium-dependent dicarboxylate transporter), member 2/3/5 n=2 Tax=Psychrobacter pacificensis TaxID=112002 RepID=A0A1G6Z603_9GAMM|nr:DASS family sodium-coupled anion symporter [Psychrobacter pacificensis]MBZ1391353.1 DASS family sodium-coupled anion symporter [Psychrobacter pacificensis]MED6315630.1 DASS family sodium-coupled anion symporter [Pseudomonadota bacterium]GLR29978.1 transporter divalent anion:Na+ symporter family protein [Psychrobacter pacificensis]SDD97872.1 solute carrier family 13 (sodium-dependent dicarboxylate transporter), member 2/3/5 [Psychrobacter pacificensis]
MSEKKLDSHIPDDGNEYLFTDTFPKGTGKGLIVVAIAAIISFIIYSVLPFEVSANKGLAMLFFIGVLWLTEAIHVTITAILVVVVGTLIGIPDFNAEVGLQSFASPIIYLFFGGFALAAALHVQKLDRKIALKILSLSGGKLSTAVLLIFGVTAFLSMWISNTATTAMMLPLALGILTQVDSKEDRGTFVFVLLGIAYSASLGGLGTIVGSPPNAIAAKALDIAFVDWMKFGIPMMLILLPVLLGAMYLFLKPNLNRTMTLQQDETIHWTKPRVLTIIVFIVTAMSWILSKQIGAAVGIEDTDAVVALLAAVAVVSLGLVSWKQVSDNTDWGVLMLFGGGIALSNILKVSGASLVLGETVANGLQTAPLLVVMLAISAFIIFLTEFASNTASAALLVPVFAAIAEHMGIPSEVLVLIIGIGASCAFMLPVATPPNAIVFGTGLIKQTEMVRTGVILNIISTVIVGCWAYFFLL